MRAVEVCGLNTLGENRVCFVRGRVRFSLGGAREANDVGGGKMNFCGSECKLFVVLEELKKKGQSMKILHVHTCICTCT